MGINGLYQIVRTEMELPPLGGAVFIFFSKNRQQVKMLKWDGDGFLLYQKRLERGTFELPFFDPQSKQCKMPYKTLSAIMSGICLKSMRYRKRLNLYKSLKLSAAYVVSSKMCVYYIYKYVKVLRKQDFHLFFTLKILGKCKFFGVQKAKKQQILHVIYAVLYNRNNIFTSFFVLPNVLPSVLPNHFFTFKFIFSIMYCTKNGLQTIQK